ncbi:Cyclophilin-like protein [Arthroderma uncinatum]|uniref:Cyclophilin-like protein n=1 Tax=Arthroderma uncinatum TaxID=74035 RepID=UPI00144ABB9B|nr:Cyclophilin-like protein [Arthroderma uncinatum]KAF3481806.1 Cyclophilin-like protein [Arthroderma uncinatum]
MSDILEFHVPEVGLTFRVKLVTDNPDVVEQVLAQLPLKSVLGHVVIAGETFWTPTRILHTGRNNMVERRLGNVYLNAMGQSICLTYGKITESARVNKFGQVFDEDLAILSQVGNLVYAKTIAQPRRQILEVHISSQVAHPGRSLDPPEITESDAGWRKAKATIEKEIDRVWLQEPEEIQKIRCGVIESGAGTGEQYFTVLVHLEAFLMVLGGDLIQRLLKISQYDDVQLPTLIRITRELLIGDFDLFEFMTDLGLTNMHQISQMYSEALDTLTTKEEYAQLTGAMVTYVNRMHRWSYFIFPWNLGVAFPHRKPSEIAALSKMIG